MDLIDDAFAELIENIDGLGKSSQKLVILAYMLREIDFNTVSKFALQWQSIDAGSKANPQHIPVPIMYLTMKDRSEKVILTEEDKENLEKSVEDFENDTQSDEK